MEGMAIIIMGVTGTGKSGLNEERIRSRSIPPLPLGCQSKIDSVGLIWLILTLLYQKRLSTIGVCLSKVLHCEFVDADDYHSQANKEKMHSGMPLTDEDRLPWLQTLAVAIKEHITDGKTLVVACSALQPMYREILRTAGPDSTIMEDSVMNTSGKDKLMPKQNILFICLQGSAELIASRLNRRANNSTHFMPPSLLQSQMDLLQIDDSEGILCIDITPGPEEITKKIVKELADMQLIEKKLSG